MTAAIILISFSSPLQAAFLFKWFLFTAKPSAAIVLPRLRRQRLKLLAAMMCSYAFTDREPNAGRKYFREYLPSTFLMISMSFSRH
jgi:hypothetical protein